MTSESSQIVFVSFPSLFDEPMKAQSFQDSGYLSSGLIGEMTPQMFVLKPGDVELSSRNGLKQCLIFLIKEVKSTEPAFVVDDGLAYLVQMSNDGAVTARKPVEQLVNLPYVQLIGQLLCLIPIRNIGEGIVHKREGNSVLAQLSCQPAVSVKVDL